MTNPAVLTFPAFDIDAEPQSAGPWWKKRLDHFNNFLVAMDITDGARQKALLLHFAGDRVAGIWDTLKPDPDDVDFDTTKTKLTTHFSPQVHVDYEIFMFREAEQKEGETVDQFWTRLRQLVQICEWVL